MVNPYTKILHSIVKLDENVVGAVIIADELHSYIRPNIIKLTERDVVKASHQIEHVMSIGLLNEKICGELNYIMFKFKFLSIMLFSLGPLKILAIGLGEPYELEKKLVKKINRLAGNLRKEPR